MQQSAVPRCAILGREHGRHRAVKRRQFITLLSGAAVAWPLAARAQQSGRLPRVGVLMNLAERDPEGLARIAAFQEGLW